MTRCFRAGLPDLDRAIARDVRVHHDSAIRVSTIVLAVADIAGITVSTISLRLLSRRYRWLASPLVNAALLIGDYHWSVVIAR